METLRRLTGPLASVALALSLAVALPGCVWDEGIHKRCVWTLHPDNPSTFYYDTTDCPAADPINNTWGTPHWYVGVNALGKTQTGNCGPKSQGYKLNAAGSPVQLGWFGGAAGGYTVDMRTSGDSCTDNGEISYAMFDFNNHKIVGLTSHNEIALIRQAGIHHVYLEMYFKAPDGTQRDLTVALPPNSADPRYNNPKSGVLFAGDTGGGNIQVILSGKDLFGLPSLCPGGSCGGFVTYDVNWEQVFDTARQKGYLGSIDKASVTTAALAIGTQTFDLGSRAEIYHRNWRAGGQ